MQFQRKLTLIATIMAMFAFASAGVAQIAPIPSNQTPSGTMRPFSGHYFQAPKSVSQSSSNKITITTESGSSLGMQRFAMTMPSDSDIRSLQVMLNGKDVSDRFQPSGCGGGVCAFGMLTTQDGMSPVKNVLVATVKLTSGGQASGRWRAMNAPASQKKGVRLAAPQTMLKANGAAPVPVANAAAVCDPVNMCPTWLSPSVRFDTLTPGGWQMGANPWIKVNGVGYGYYGGTVGTPHYAVVVLDRQSLQLVDWEWFATGTDFTTYLKTLPSTDLVIAGTTALAGDTLSSDVDTTAIGGTNFTQNWQGAFPNSYMVIGHAGQAAGTAYENMRSANAFATGSLLEDANGNYNFQSSDIVEYAIEPQDPDNYGNPDIQMTVPANLSVNGESSILFEANAQAGQNGLWLLVLDRTTLMPPYNLRGSGCADVNPVSAPTRVMQGCGTFYPLGAGNPDLSGQWQGLANALSAVTSDQIVFLQSIGQVGVIDLPSTVGYGGSGFTAFSWSLMGVGGTVYGIAGPTFTNKDNYALVGYKGAGNALTGGAAELSTAFPGQMGVLHGTLQRDRTGLYRPGQSSPEQQGLFNFKGGIKGSDFTLGITSYQQPVEWPSNSATVPLPGASTITGQQAAYRFISHWLLAGYYMKTIQGPHQDDIHFFFSGSTNTSLNYQTMDPANLPSPGLGTWASFGCTSFDGTTCTFQAPGDSATSTFTMSDFNAVKAQLSLEVIYLTNTLQYLVTGSTNLKDVVASGSANVGLALSAAANTIEGSGMGNLNSQEIASKQVTFSWQSLLGFLGGVAQIAADLEGVGALTPVFEDMGKMQQKDYASIAAGANAVGAMIATAGSGGGIRTSSTTLSSSPQPFAQLTTTVGELATQNLQSPLIIGFDTTADNITSDWGRLSTIGPRTTNTTDTVFFAPNQVTQVTAINALTNAAASNFYFSLLPTVYSIHVWNGVNWSGHAAGVFQPTVGSLETHDEYDQCNAFYLNPNTTTGGQTLGTLSIYQGMTYPMLTGWPQVFTQDLGYVDFWVMDGVVSKAGSNSTNIAVIDSNLATSLFAPDQLNTPMLQFFSGNGPMATVVKDASSDGVSGWSNGNICDASDPTYNPSIGSGLSAPPPSGKTPTTTTLTSPVSGVLGHDAVFTAQVMASNQPVPSGIVYISIDGAVVGNPTVGTNGIASFTVPGGLTLGNHKIAVDYAAGAGSSYAASSAQPSSYTVYSESADILISMANTSMNASYTSTSAPVSMQINSVAGLTGDVVLSCTGLPAGLACSFNSQSLKLAADGSVNATVQIVPTPTTQTSSLLWFFPLLGLGCFVGVDGRSRRRVVLAILLLASTSVILTGCAGGSSAGAPTTVRETGPKTITVNARVGSISRSMGVDVNVQP